MQHRNSLILATVLIVAATSLAGTWMAAPGKGSHAAAGGSTVTIDTVATAVSAVSALSVSITTAVVGSGSNRLLVVGTAAGDATIGDRTVDSVSSSLDGAFTLLAGSAGDDAAFCRSELWYKVAPTTGTHTITVTFSAGAGTDTVAANAISFTGVNQSTPFGTAVAVNGTSVSTAPTTGSITLGTGELAMAAISSDSGPTLTMSVGTQRWQILQIATDTSFGGATRTTTGAITWTTASEKYGISAAPIKAAP